MAFADILRAVKSSMDDAADLIDSVWKGSFKGITTGAGTANAHTASVTNFVLETGTVVAFIPSNANTGAATLNVTSSGIKNIKYCGQALVGGELQTSVPAVVQYDGTQWNLLNHGGGWATWTPTIAGTASMTVSATSTSYAKYQRHGSKIVFRMKCNFTPGGTRNGKVSLTLPVAPLQAGSIGFACEVFDSGLSGDVALGHAFSISSTTIYAFRQDQATWSATTCSSYIGGEYDV